MRDHKIYIVTAYYPLSSRDICWCLTDEEAANIAAKCADQLVHYNRGTIKNINDLIDVGVQYQGHVEYIVRELSDDPLVSGYSNSHGHCRGVDRSRNHL